jgi:hypothetical protein
VDDFDVDDWRKSLSEEDYMVTRAVVSQHDGPADAASRDDETSRSSSNP